MAYLPEPAYQHGQRARTGVLLVNLGSPAEPTAGATRRYLAQFLSDPRVVEIPRLAWLPILHGIILRTRPAKSAAKYASIWTPEGSPLVAGTARLARLLQGHLGERSLPLLVRHAMRYGQPSVAAELEAMKAEGATRILGVGRGQHLETGIGLEDLHEQQGVDAVVVDIEDAQRGASRRTHGCVSPKRITSKATTAELASAGEPPRPMWPWPCKVQLPRRKLTISPSAKRT